jgi:hypothetical protein
MAIVAIVFFGAFAVRWATQPGLGGDDHWPLWTAATFLKGDLPFRDFVDAGNPLHWGISALVQALVGYRLIGEVVLGTTLVAFAFAAAFHLAWSTTRSVGIALALTALALAWTGHASLYSYPKMFLYPLVLWLGWRYIDRPSPYRSAVLALSVVVAFGYRHDHGVYAGIGAAAAVLAAHSSEGLRRIAFSLARFGLLLALMLGPYLTVIHLNEGLVPYFRDRVAMAGRLDASSRRPVWFERNLDGSAKWFRLIPPQPARVFIRWAPSLSNSARSALERSYGLTNPMATEDGKHSVEYALADITTTNIRALVQDPRISDTGLLDRKTFRPMEESWLMKAQRAVPLFRISFAPRYWHAGNTGILLHYISYALPFVILLLLVADRIRGQRGKGLSRAEAKYFTAGLLGAAVYVALVRRPEYFADHGTLAIVNAACLWDYAFPEKQITEGGVSLRLKQVLTGCLLAVVILTTVTYARNAATLPQMNSTWLRLWRESVERFDTYSTAPPIDAYAPPGTTGERALFRYLYECTRPNDRVWVATDLFGLPYYIERRVVQHIYWANGIKTGPEYERRVIDRVEAEEVPIVVGSGPDWTNYFTHYPLVRAYIAHRYPKAYVLPSGGTGTYTVLTDSRRTPTGVYKPLGLPCFR